MLKLQPHDTNEVVLFPMEKLQFCTVLRDVVLDCGEDLIVPLPFAFDTLCDFAHAVNTVCVYDNLTYVPTMEPWSAERRYRVITVANYLDCYRLIMTAAWGDAKKLLNKTYKSDVGVSKVYQQQQQAPPSMWSIFLGISFIVMIMSAIQPVNGITTRCTDADRHIFNAQGSTFIARFRSFGGAFVTKASFESKVAHATGLSPACASCYGDSYICGYDNCKWKCAMDGETCTTCLHTAKCIETCNTCTGFIHE